MSGVVLNYLGNSEEESKSKTMSQEQRRQIRREVGSKEDSPSCPTSTSQPKNHRSKVKHWQL